MKVNIRAWSRAAITAALFSVTAAGCGDDADPSLLLPSAFPGSSVEDAFLASDGVAFSESGLYVSAGSVQVFRNVSNNDAIVTFVASTNGGGLYGLYASYYNGSRFTQPVDIRGADEDRSEQPHDVRVLFLETSRYSGANGGATSNGRGRDGDAIIAYVGTDIDDPASVDRDANDRAYATYFDRSASGKAAKDGVVNGFTVTSTAFDFDNLLPDDMMGGADVDPSVSYVGFASDSLHGTHEFGSGAMGGVLSGDPTSVVQLLFRKSPQTAVATPIAERWFAVPFDLGQEGNAIVAQAGGTVGIINPAAGTLESGDTTGTRIVVSDATVLSTATGADGTFPMGSDVVVTATTFSGTATTSINLGSDSTTHADTTNLPSVDDVYGPDHGAGALYAFFTESGFSDGSATGQRATDADLMVAQIDAGSSTRAIAEIDEFKGTVDITDGDADFSVVRTGGAGGVSGGLRTALHRDGGLISVAFAQPTTDATDSNDASNTVGAPAANTVHRLQVLATNRAAGSLGSAVLDTPIRVPALASTGAAGSTPAPVYQAGTTAFEFQLGLPTGRAAVAGGPNEADDIEQTNANVVFFRYTQYNDQSQLGAIPGQVRLFTSGISVTPGSEGTAPTATAIRGSIAEAVVQFPEGSANTGSHQNWGNEPFNAVVVDNFDPNGGAYTFFASNDNHVADDPYDAATTGEYEATRLYAWNGTTRSLVSSAGTLDRQVRAGGPIVHVVKKRIHVFWGEYETTSESQVRLATRSFSGVGTLTSVPAAEVGPAFIDLATPGDLNQPYIVEGTDRIGVFFQEGEHLYYNETRSDAAHYRVADGLSNPTLVDNDSTAILSSYQIFFNDGANQLSRSFVFWSKAPAADWSGSGPMPRLQIRVRD